MLLFITKSKQDNDVIDRIGVIFIEYNTKMSILIEQCAVYDEDKTEQWHDPSYRFALHWKWN